MGIRRGWYGGGRKDEQDVVLAREVACVPPREGCIVPRGQRASLTVKELVRCAGAGAGANAAAALR